MLYHKITISSKPLLLSRFVLDVVDSLRYQQQINRRNLVRSSGNTIIATEIYMLRACVPQCTRHTHCCHRRGGLIRRDNLIIMLA